MGRRGRAIKARRLVIQAEKEQEKAAGNKVRNYMTAWALFIVIIFYIGLYLLQRTIIPESVLYIAAGIGCLLGAVILRFTIRLPFWAILFLSAVTSAGLAPCSLMVVNYAFTSSTFERFQLPVADYHFERAARHSTRRPMGEFYLDGIKHSLFIPEGMEDNYRSCRSVTVWVYKGCLGYYVVNSYEFSTTNLEAAGKG
ncbi:hypothetical protein [Chitinophaga barathri]|uniref:Uncharacterized protein n=1 Tax=Chitinophaga barathri TaxID=1647451 RepID=A0A3N4MD15_9BACT|nr:hypothetical protein [Chitinophaga barathri]RPD41822.1 hypothetical protein EG028_06555 [Chitinophaga barathri]